MKKLYLFFLIIIIFTSCDQLSVITIKPDKDFHVGQTINLSSKKSKNRNNAFYSKWEITQAPAGSIAELSTNNEKTITFTPDLAGKYIINLITFQRNSYLYISGEDEEEIRIYHHYAQATSVIISVVSNGESYPDLLSFSFLKENNIGVLDSDIKAYITIEDNTNIIYVHTKQKIENNVLLYPSYTFSEDDQNLILYQIISDNNQPNVDEGILKIDSNNFSSFLVLYDKKNDKIINEYELKFITVY